MKKIEYIFKNLLLQLLIFFSSFRRKSESKKEFKKVLFVRLNKIGDALVTTPLLFEIKSRLKCSVFVLADKKIILYLKIIFGRQVISTKKA
jgi:hypothetical protein